MKGEDYLEMVCVVGQLIFQSFDYRNIYFSFLIFGMSSEVKSIDLTYILPSQTKLK